MLVLYTFVLFDCLGEGVVLFCWGFFVCIYLYFCLCGVCDVGGVFVCFFGQF